MANAPRVDDAFGEEVAQPRDQRQDAFGRKMIHRVGRIGGERQYAKPRAGVARQRRLEQRAVEPLRILKRSEEHTSELQSLMRISYAVFCLKKKKNKKTPQSNTITAKNIKNNRRKHYKCNI